ncbi:ATP-binding protein [Roseovarius sp. EL26]|uniref:hybrid sensor histidine kinase/response regulator n=1 Tax=Roseovarius sp. EL26 TaxID=2126672 RepID=UPI0020B12C1E|nr:ATP-binding protein [Roseovarius sp. EL26]
MLSTAQNDDVSWNVSQLEVEVLRLQNAAYEAAQDSDSTLSEFRTRFDIFYSRVSTLTQSILYEKIQDNSVVKSGLQSITDFLDTTTPIVDGPDAVLRNALADIQSQIIIMRPNMRSLALASIQIHAQEEAIRRKNFSQTLVKLSISGLALIFALILAVLVLVKLYRRSQRFSHDNQIVHSKFEAAVASSLDAVLVVDTFGKIIEFNGAAESVFGYAREDALGGDMAEMIVPEHMRKMHFEGMNRFLETGDQRVIGAGRIRLEGMRKSGEVFPVELSISLSEANGERVFVSFLRDITKELKAEEELRSARDKAQESEKAKSELLTIMSHEMRTPLNGILGSLSLINLDNLSERQKRHLNSITVSGELLLSHVNDVLDLSSLSADTSQQEETRFDLRDLVQKVADSLRANAEARGTKLKVEFLSTELEVVLGYKMSLQQCLMNLVGNAIKFTSEGTVAIEVERLSSDNLVEIRVSDNGVGIASENLDRVFEEFVTIDTTFSRKNVGTGLGLAITKRLVETMNGEIEADSIISEGSLFTIRLPLPMVEPMPQPDPEKFDILPITVMANFKAIIVDDNEINRMIMTDMLLDIGFNVEQASDGYEAIKMLSQNAFDIAFIDISMPGIDGIETLNSIRALDVAWSNVPAIAVTAHTSEQDKRKILQAPFEALLVKPVDLNELNANIIAILEGEKDFHIDESGSNTVTDFQRRFGEKKYLDALKDLGADLQNLYRTLEREPELSLTTKQKAHKLSGSASILGKQSLWSDLQKIENCDAEAWLSIKHTVLPELAREISELL